MTATSEKTTATIEASVRMRGVPPETDIVGEAQADELPKLSRALHRCELERSDEPTHVFDDVHRLDAVALPAPARRSAVRDAAGAAGRGRIAGEHRLRPGGVVRAHRVRPVARDVRGGCRSREPLRTDALPRVASLRTIHRSPPRARVARDVCGRQK